MYPSRVRSLKSMMNFLWDFDGGDPSAIDRIIERNGWTDLRHLGEGSICTDGKMMLAEVGCGACNDIILEEYIPDNLS